MVSTGAKFHRPSRWKWIALEIKIRIWDDWRCWYKLINDLTRKLRYTQPTFRYPSSMSRMIFFYNRIHASVVSEMLNPYQHNTLIQNAKSKHCHLFKSMLQPSSAIFALRNNVGMFEGLSQYDTNISIQEEGESLCSNADISDRIRDCWAGAKYINVECVHCVKKNL